MDPQRWTRIEYLYHAALEKEPSERSNYLADACGSDSDLQREVETLLGYAKAELQGRMADAALADLRQKNPELPEDVQRLLRAREDTVTIPGEANGVSQISHNPRVNDLIGSYRLLSILGEGGMGIVYLAEQERPIRRRVALKLIKPGIASAAAIARFESERQALAMMDHPNIAHVYDAGATETGQPYFVMEYVSGPSITAYCDQHKLTNRERLKLFRSVCLAIHHAHQKGVIHQDIKPSNVLVTEQDGAPVPKVIDFGIAKAIEQRQAGQTLFTLRGVLAGTPEYMSPEQANLDARDIDSTSDVYSLGILLYELLVGALPFDPKELRKKGLAEILRVIREDSPTPLASRLGTLPTAQEIAQFRDTDPGTLRRQLTGELDWITTRAMEKDRRRRYNSAAEFAGDIGRYLNNEPVIASPPSHFYRVRKFVSKHRWPVAAAAAVVAALCTGVVTSTLLYFRAERSRGLAESRELLYWANGSLNEDPERSLILGLYSWDKSRTMLGGLEQLLHDAVLQSLVRWTLNVPGGLGGAAWSPDWSKLATNSGNTARVWDASTGRELLTLRGHSGPVLGIAWSPDGSKLATASADQTAKVWEAATGSELLTLHGHSRHVSGIAWSPDGSKLATASDDQTTKVWDAATGRELLVLRGDQATTVLSVAWSPNGSKLATIGKTARVWDAATGRELLTIRDDQGFFLGVAWSPDGRRLATAGADATAKVWDAATGSELLTLRGHSRPVGRIAWSPDGSKLATASNDQTVKVWDASAGQELLTLRGNQSAVYSIAWSPDGSKLASASRDGWVKVWDSGGPRELVTLRGHSLDVLGVAWSPDGSKLATGSNDQTAKLWDAATGRELLTLRGHQGIVYGIAWSPDGSKLATASNDQIVKVWDATSGRELLTHALRGNRFLAVGVAWSPDGRKLSAAGSDHTTEVWDADTGRELLAFDNRQGLIMDIGWSPDGNRLATASQNRTVRVWESVTGRELLTIGGHQSEVTSTKWSPDGSKLATTSNDGTAKVWDSATGRELLTLRGHEGVYGVTWSPDGARLATAGRDQIVQVYAFDPVLLIRLVRSRITRDLTPDECRRYLNADHCPPLPLVP